MKPIAWLVFIEHLQWARLHAQQFSCIISLNLHLLEEPGALLYPFYRWGSETTAHTQSISGKVRINPRSTWLASPQSDHIQIRVVLAYVWWLQETLIPAQKSCHSDLFSLHGLPHNGCYTFCCSWTPASPTRPSENSFSRPFLREIQNHHSWMTSDGLFSVWKSLCIFVRPWLWLCFMASPTASWLLDCKLASAGKLLVEEEKHYWASSTIPESAWQLAKTHLLLVHNLAFWSTPKTLGDLVNVSHSPSWVNSGCTPPRGIWVYKDEDSGDAKSYSLPWGSCWVNRTPFLFLPLSLVQCNKGAIW